MKRSWTGFPTSVAGMTPVKIAFWCFSIQQKKKTEPKRDKKNFSEKRKLIDSLSKAFLCVLVPLFRCLTAMSRGTQRSAPATSPLTPPPSPTLKTTTAIPIMPASTTSASHPRLRHSSSAHPHPEARQQGPTSLRLPWRSWMVSTQR